MATLASLVLQHAFDLPPAAPAAAVEDTPQAFNEDPRVETIRADAERAERETLLTRRKRRRDRRQALRRARAGTRARAAAAGVAGGRSAEAVERGQAREAAREDAFDAEASALRMAEIDAAREARLQDVASRRRRDLLAETERRRRAAAGIADQLLPRAPFPGTSTSARKDP